MNKNRKIAITGASGFIGSCLAKYLNDAGYHQLILVDDFSYPKKVNNLKGVEFAFKVHREQFIDWWQMHPEDIDFVFHLGARTDTTEKNYALLKSMNLEYSKRMWEYCESKKVPFIYASSAATYGAGEQGYKDDEARIAQLKPLNPYGISKNEFDIWVLEQKQKPPFWAGLKFFNVYGQNEYHKGRMASVIFHVFNQIRNEGKACLFRSHHPDYADGGQLRDFIYVKDVLSVLVWLMNTRPLSGIYNLGTGRARTFNDLATAVFNTLNRQVNIEYIDTPEDIRENYQYFTEADMGKLKNAGYLDAFHTLEEGVTDYLSDLLKSTF